MGRKKGQRRRVRYKEDCLKKLVVLVELEKKYREDMAPQPED